MNAPGAISSRQVLQIILITAGALGLYAFLRALPTGSNLNHVDFRIDGSNTLEFCDPSNPQFIPVVTVRSPVNTRLVSSGPAEVGRERAHTLVLSTAGGKPIGAEDLLVMHTRRLHLMVVDPTLLDYQHLHPEPGERPGEWVFTHTPRLAGEYRVFADFTPTATGRGLYASAAFSVPGDVAVNMRILDWTAEAGGHRFTLTPSEGTIRAGRPASLTLSISRPDGAPVSLQPVMDAYAHLVAFDAGRNGFAHLHPNEPDLSHVPDAENPRLSFMVTIPEAGLYVIWAQVNPGGRELFVPFWLEVAP